MVTKRTAAYIHPSRRDRIPNEHRRKRQKPDNAGAKTFKKAHPVNELKSQIRSLRRLLERNDSLPADVRVEKERALQTARHELEEAEKARRRNEMIGRYHKIRFFDRQKATKRLKRARKELDGCPDGDEGRTELARRVQDAEVDINYAQYYPLDRHYVSLFPRRKTKGDDDDNSEEGEDGANGNEAIVERKGDTEMWERVKQCMANGTLDALRNGKLTEAEESVPEKKEKHKADEDTTARSVRQQRKGLAGTEDREEKEADKDSDDGFFE